LGKGTTGFDEEFRQSPVVFLKTRKMEMGFAKM